MSYRKLPRQKVVPSDVRQCVTSRDVDSAFDQLEVCGGWVVLVGVQTHLSDRLCPDQTPSQSKVKTISTTWHDTISQTNEVI